MEQSIITTGKTIDLAVSAALEQLKLDRDSVSVEVLENARSGFFGIGASPAKVKVTYEIPDPKPALSSASRSKPKKPAPAKEEAPRAAEKPADKPAKTEPRQPRRERPAREKTDVRAEKPAAPAAPKTYAPAQPGSVEERLEVFLKGLLEHMGSEAVPHAYRKDEGIYGVDLVGESLGALIGRRGDTLDAIQHLCNYTINRGASERIRVNVDAENYRGKREEALERLAHKMAAKAVKYRRNFPLEPMNAYERHVIHACLQDEPNVTTFSTGTEPNRRIVISYAKEK